MRAAFDAILRRVIMVGRLTVRWPDGRVTTYAGPPGSGPEAAFALRDAATVRRLVLNPAVASARPIWTAAWSRSTAASTRRWTCWCEPDGEAEGHPIARFRAALGQLKRRIDQYNPGTARSAMWHITTI